MPRLFGTNCHAEGRRRARSAAPITPMPMPVAGGRLPAPVAGAKFPTPVAGGRLPAPVAGGRLPAPVAGGKFPIPSLQSREVVHA
jgi:hypothetical protein